MHTHLFRIPANLTAVLIAALAVTSATGAEGSQNNSKDREQTLDFGFPCTNPARSNGAERTIPKIEPNRPLSQPEYPPFAKHSNQEGTTILKLLITDAGRVGEVQVERTSGWPLLDNAAMEGTRAWEFTPGTEANKPVCMWVSVPVVFKLSDYLDKDLRAAKVTPQAEVFARLVMGESELRRTLETISTQDATLGDISRSLYESLSAQEQWKELIHRLAAMYSIEMSPEELSKLVEHFSSPEMKKFVSLLPNFETELRRVQLSLGSMMYCTVGGIDASARKKLGVVYSEKELLKEVAARVPTFVKEMQPYCTCVAETAQMNLKTKGGTDRCGKPPELTW